MTLLYYLDIFGTFAFAVSGAFRAIKYELDILGVIMLGLVTGVGGGILRDILLGHTPPMALYDQTYVITCVLGAVTVFYLAPFIAKRWDRVMLADAIGLSVFTAIGAAQAANANAVPVTIVFMAMITACGGGVIRDMFVGEIPAILKVDFYASAALVGGGFFVLLEYFHIEQNTALWITIALTLIVRFAAIYFHLHLPLSKPLSASPSEITRERKALKKQRKQYQK
jgi:uncharacterized membrane protein YeiH